MSQRWNDNVYLSPFGSGQALPHVDPQQGGRGGTHNAVKFSDRPSGDRDIRVHTIYTCLWSYRAPSGVFSREILLPAAMAHAPITIKDRPVIETNGYLGYSSNAQVLRDFVFNDI